MSTAELLAMFNKYLSVPELLLLLQKVHENLSARNPSGLDYVQLHALLQNISDLLEAQGITPPVYNVDHLEMCNRFMGYCRDCRQVPRSQSAPPRVGTPAPVDIAPVGTRRLPIPSRLPMPNRLPVPTHVVRWTHPSIADGMDTVVEAASEMPAAMKDRMQLTTEHLEQMNAALRQEPFNGPVNSSAKRRCRNGDVATC